MRRTHFYAGILFGIFLTMPLTVEASAEMEPLEEASNAVTVCILDSGCNLSDVQGQNYLDGLDVQSPCCGK